MFDGVKLVKVENPLGIAKWQCEAPCEKNKKKKKISIRKSNNRVIIGEVWTNSLLERLSTQLSVRTSNLQPAGDTSKSACPAHYNYDLMIPLVHASEQEPLGWLLFGAKYLHDVECEMLLREHIARELPDHKFAVSLVDLVIDNYCFGLVISGRSLRRQLDIGRGVQHVYHVAMQKLLSRFHVIEENYARIVKRYL